jgi:beta-carotene 3-hydroxylase
VLTLWDVATTLATFVLMEPFAWVLHRYVMHGIGWGWHQTHHRPHAGYWETNDLYSLVFALPSMALFALGYGVPGYRACWFVGLGVVLYGVAYFVVHDGLVHQRFPLRLRARGVYLKRLVQAHRLHHAAHTREGAVSFGFLYARDPRVLARELRAR